MSIESEILLDVSKHNFQCLEHGKKSEFFCVAKDCNQRLFCFTCLRTLKSHPHNLGESENINTDLFRVKLEKRILNTSQIKDLAAEVVKTSQESQNKLKSILEVLKAIENEFSKPEALTNADYTSLIDSSKRALRTEYEKQKFEQCITDGSKFNSLIKIFLELREKIDLHNHKPKPEHFLETLTEAAEAIDKLGHKIESLTQLFGNKDPTHTLDSKNSPDTTSLVVDLTTSVDQHNALTTVQNSNPSLEQQSHPVEMIVSRSNCFAVKSDVMEEVHSKQIQFKSMPQPNNTKLPPQQTSSNGNSGKKVPPQIEALIAQTKKSASSQKAQVSPTRNTNQHSKSNSMHQEASTEVANCTAYFQVKHPDFSREFLLKRLAYFLEEENEFKPKVDDLHNFLLDASGEFDLDTSQCEYRKAIKIVKLGKTLQKRCEEVLEFQYEKGKNFRNELSDLLGYLFSKQNGKYLELKEMNAEFKTIKTSVENYVHEKMKTKEALLTIVKELNGCKLDFSKETKALNEEIKASEQQIDQALSQIEQFASSDKKVKVSFLTERTLDLLELPLRTEKLCKLVQKFLSVQKFKVSLVDAFGKYSFIVSKKANPKDTLEFRNLEKLVIASKFKKYDFELEAKEIWEHFMPEKLKESENQLYENLRKDPQRKVIKTGDSKPRNDAASDGQDDNSSNGQEKHRLSTESTKEVSNQDSNGALWYEQVVAHRSEVRKTVSNGNKEATALKIGGPREQSKYSLFLSQQTFLRESKGPTSPFLMTMLDMLHEKSVKKIKGNDGSPIF